MMQRIYFDNNATTPTAPEVKTAILPYLTERFGNPSSAHCFGEEAGRGVAEAREQVAGLFGVSPARIFFTSGGTESNNIAIFSAAAAFPPKKHIISSTVEHPSVSVPLDHLAQRGYEIERLPVDRLGALDLAELRAAIREDTLLVSLMGANNETGVLWPLAEIGGICREAGVLFHSDVVQLAGKEKIDAAAIKADYLTVAGHKLHGPKGVGALYAARTAPVSPVILGAGQEGGKRAGTENTPGIAGLGRACSLAKEHLADYRREVAALRDHLEEGLLASVPDALVIGLGSERLANTLNICFRHCSSAGLIQELDTRGIAVSGHSACHSGDLDPSPVLAAMGVAEDYLHGALRISLSRYNTTEEAARLLDILPKLVQRARQGFAL